MSRKIITPAPATTPIANSKRRMRKLAISELLAEFHADSQRLDRHRIDFGPAGRYVAFGIARHLAAAVEGILDVEIERRTAPIGAAREIDLGIRRRPADRRLRIDSFCIGPE